SPRSQAFFDAVAGHALEAIDLLGGQLRPAEGDAAPLAQRALPSSEGAIASLVDPIAGAPAFLVRDLRHPAGGHLFAGGIREAAHVLGEDRGVLLAGADAIEPAGLQLPAVFEVLAGELAARPTRAGGEEDEGEEGEEDPVHDQEPRHGRRK